MNLGGCRSKCTRQSIKYTLVIYLCWQGVCFCLLAAVSRGGKEATIRNVPVGSVYMSFHEPYSVHTCLRGAVLNPFLSIPGAET